MDTETQRRVSQIATDLLVKADALGRIPTPLDEVLSAAGLVEPQQSLLAPELVAQAPSHIQGAISKLLSRVRGLLDRRAREVHLDPTVTSEGKRRFIKGHEIIHQAAPWQLDLVHADDDYRLAPDVRFQFELEANFGAAELLFQGKRFTDEAADLEVGMASVVAASQRYHTSIESALWRYVECNREPMLAVVLDPSPISRDPLRFKRRQLVRSVAFRDRCGDGVWPGTLDATSFRFLHEAVAASATRVAVPGEWTLHDRDGDAMKLRTECLATGYAVLVLMWVPKRSLLKRKARLVA